MLAAHPSSELYGSDRMFLESVAGLGEAGWDVVVTLPSPGPLVAALEATGARVVLTPVPVLRKSALRPAGFAALVADALRGLPSSLALVRSADVVYASTLTVPSWTVLARLLRRPVLCHVHEAEGSASPALRHAMALPVRLASSVVLNSEFSRDVLASSAPGLARRSRVLLNGVEGPAAVVPPREHLDGPVRLLYVGRLSPRKGVDVAVDAVGELVASGTDARLDVVGSAYDGYDWFSDQLEAAVERHGLAERVTFHGFRDDVWPLAGASDIVVVPSVVDEPFGNTAVEAVLAARPAVVSDTSGLRQASAGYASAQQVTPGDASALAAAVRTVVAGWDRFRADAVADSAVARERHAPARYRRDVAAAVAALLPARATGDRSVPASSPAAHDHPAAESVVVCVLTYRRGEALAALLPVLAAQAAACVLRAEVLVVDNDPDASARDLVAGAGLDRVRYVHEATPGIAAARNRGLEEAAGADLLVFIDDDERPVDAWLASLLATHAETGSAAVVGPVVSEYARPPEPWVAAGRFFDRRRLPTGTPVQVAATNNLLLDLRQVRELGLRFDERFGLSGGSDTLFTRELVRRGGRMVWNDEALVVDDVPVDRLTRRWVLLRALRSGNSWSRTELELTPPGPRKLLVRGRLTAMGAPRVVVGGARAVAGLALRDHGHQARGVRGAARGVGLVSGAFGYVYSEYRRTGRRPLVRGRRSPS